MNGQILRAIQASLGMSLEQAVRLIVRSPHTYKVYEIPKKSGGLRTIAQPAKETKLIQRWLIDNVFCSLPVHHCATAYKRGASIKANAGAHAQNAYISKFDFTNFFSSIKEADVALHLAENLGEVLSRDEILWIARVSCVRSRSGGALCLSVGAPSSPLLSNSVMYRFDTKLNQWCSERGLVYTRYADDLTFSSSIEGLSKDIEFAIRDILRDISYPKLSLNDRKTIHVSKKHQRRITGIIINNEGALSLGRDRKRMISALIHKFTLNQISTSDAFKLQGLLGFARDVEPAFVLSMRKKYGSSVIDAILQIRKQ